MRWFVALFHVVLRDSAAFALALVGALHTRFTTVTDQNGRSHQQRAKLTIVLLLLLLLLPLAASCCAVLFIMVVCRRSLSAQS